MKKKINFIKLIQVWGIIFLIGLGVSIVAIDVLDSYYDFDIKTKMLYSLLVIIMLFAVLLLFYNWLNQKFKKDFKLFISFFKRVAHSDEEIDRENIKFVELDQMAKYANKMLTERKAAAKELRESQNDLTEMFEMSLNLICIADINTATFLKVNPAFTRVLGYSEQELLNRPFLDFVHPEDVDSTLSIIDKKLKKGEKVFNFTNRYRNRDGSYCYLEWTSHPIPERGITYAFAHDITDRKQAEKLLKMSEVEYKSTLNDLLIGVVVHAGDSRILLSNPEARNILGLTEEQMLGKLAIDPAWSFVHEDLSIMELVDYPVKNVLSTKNPLYNYIFGINRPDRDYITWVNVNAVPVFSKPVFSKPVLSKPVLSKPVLSEPDELEKVIVNFVDITDHKQAEAELITKNKDLETFNRMAVDRELKMVELKKEINHLAQEAGLELRYVIAK